MLQTLKANDGLVVALALCVGFSLVLALMAGILRAAGASVRPIWFLAGLFVPIGLPFLIGQLISARKPVEAGGPSPDLEVRDGQFAARATLFGPGVLHDLVRDAKSGLPGILNEAEHAEAGVTPTGETVLVAKFPGEEQAKRAAAAYHRGFQLRNVSGDEQRGWRAARAQGDFVEMLRTGRYLFVWSGLSRDAAAARRASSAIAELLPQGSAAAALPLVPSLQPLQKFFESSLAKVAGLLILVGIYSTWFITGAAWASSVPAIAGTQPLSASELAKRLEDLNELDVPFRVQSEPTPHDLTVDWRYADAKWTDLARVRGARRTFRIRLSLDEKSHTVRATDYTAAFDWSAGANGARINWRAASGIVFFQMEQNRALGLHLDKDGGFRPLPMQEHKFDLREMKQPLIAVAVRSGWTWKPTLWKAKAPPAQR